jgi:hypothetical protein
LREAYRYVGQSFFGEKDDDEKIVIHKKCG